MADEHWEEFADALDHLAALGTCDPGNCLVHRLEMEQRREAGEGPS